MHGDVHAEEDGTPILFSSMFCLSFHYLFLATRCLVSAKTPTSILCSGWGVTKQSRTSINELNQLTPPRQGQRGKQVVQLGQTLKNTHVTSFDVYRYIPFKISISLASQGHMFSSHYHDHSDHEPPAKFNYNI